MKILNTNITSNIGEAITMEIRANVENYNEVEFLANSINKGKHEINLLANNNLPNIKKVIFNKPATIVLWEDGTKTVVKCSNSDMWNPEKGLAMCLIKKIYGNDNSYHKIFKKWIPDNQYEFFKEALHLFEANCVIPVPVPQKSAIWIDTDEFDEVFGDVYKCSNCGYEVIERLGLNYCPRCGCKMI